MSTPTPSPTQNRFLHRSGNQLGQIHPRGSFGYQPVAGLVAHHWPPGNHEHLFMGLPAAGQHLWGLLKSEGRWMAPVRQFQNDVAVRFFLFDGEEGADLKFNPASATGYAGMLAVGERDGAWGVSQPGRSMRFGFLTNERSARWREADFFDITAEPLLNGLQMAVPDAAEPLGYLARAWRVTSGTVFGKPVEAGFIGHEQVYLSPGRGWFSSAYSRHLQKCWISFMTEFEDGQTLWGQIKLGDQGLAFAVIQRSDGPPVISTDVQCALTLDSEGFPEHIQFSLSPGEEWIYQPHPCGGGRERLPDPKGPRWREGQVFRSGDRRRIRHASAWAEVYPDRL